jgi:hypothetical protein
MAIPPSPEVAPGILCLGLRELIIIHTVFNIHELQNLRDSRLTVCVTGAGASVDSAWDQKTPEARKMLENRAESPASSARFVRLCLSRKAYLGINMILLLKGRNN